eukprot:1156982-Pelagomonas_calceolata.AAC.1
MEKGLQSAGLKAVERELAYAYQKAFPSISNTVKCRFPEPHPPSSPHFRGCTEQLTFSPNCQQPISGRLFLHAPMPIPSNCQQPTSGCSNFQYANWPDLPNLPRLPKLPAAFSQMPEQAQQL